MAIRKPLVIVSGIQQELPVGDSIDAGGLVLLSTVFADNSATVDVETGFGDAYDEYMLLASSVKPADGAQLYCRLKQNGSYQTIAYHEYAVHYVDSGGANGLYSAISDAAIKLTPPSAGSALFESNLNIRIPRNALASEYRPIGWSAFGINTAYRIYRADGAAFNRGEASVVTGIRIYGSTGNIAAGIFRLYGVRK